MRLETLKVTHKPLCRFTFIFFLTMPFYIETLNIFFLLWYCWEGGCHP